MIDFSHISRRLRTRICAEIEIAPDSDDSFRVYMPFSFDDGDSVTLTVRRSDGRWIVSDEGNAFMRLSYDLDTTALETSTRQKFIQSAFALGRSENRDGAVVRLVEGEDFGDAIFGVVQTVLRLASVALLTQERVRSAFLEDLQNLLDAVAPGRMVQPRWHDRQRDPSGYYRVDFRIEGRDQPIFLFALTNTGKVKEATIAAQQYFLWGFRALPVGIYHDPDSISKRARGQFEDVAAKTFRLAGNEERITAFLRERVRA